LLESSSGKSIREKVLLGFRLQRLIRLPYLISFWAKRKELLCEKSGLSSRERFRLGSKNFSKRAERVRSESRTSTNDFIYEELMECGHYLNEEASVPLVAESELGHREYCGSGYHWKDRLQCISRLLKEFLGRRPHPSVVRRWIAKGSGGRKLRACSVDGMLYTTYREVELWHSGATAQPLAESKDRPSANTDWLERLDIRTPTKAEAYAKSLDDFRIEQQFAESVR